jgi:type I restriction enzyme M protein
MPKRAKPDTVTSPQAKLSAVIKSARAAMRKDAGLNGDIDRIPQLAWLLFLKAFDGLEANREVVEATFRPAIEAPYRWRDWAADPNSRTGDALIEFVNSELLPYLRELVGTGSHDPRDVLAAVFKETYNRMLSGYLLRDVVNKINEVNFASADDIHTMAHLYESMLREMRDAAGDSGEFYTPRPVIRFMVHQVDPKLGEIVLDPACGTGGFLVETLEHLRPQVSTVKEQRALEGNLRGIEKKPLPYLLGMMNLLLHEMEQPNIVRGNALGKPITQIAKRERVDVVLTNPPFGGEEEKSIQANFPAATRTGETAWLFLQLVVRQLKEGGRCGIVVPNGVLFGDGIGTRIKEQLLESCNLHTVVRLPSGVFAPYTDIPANLLFFEKTGPTKDVWYYEVPPPEGRKKYSKTKPLRFEEFAECQAWWGSNDRAGRTDTEHAWHVPIGDIAAVGFNLDLKNPNRADDLAHRTPHELIVELVRVEGAILDLLRSIDASVRRAK